MQDNNCVVVIGNLVVCFLELNLTEEKIEETKLRNFVKKLIFKDIHAGM